MSALRKIRNAVRRAITTSFPASLRRPGVDVRLGFDLVTAAVRSPGFAWLEVGGVGVATARFALTIGASW
jgi:hypothetical protein